MFAPKKDNYPEPGKYEYPTYIGEGPKYTFRDKFDADGMKKEKTILNLVIILEKR